MQEDFVRLATGLEPIYTLDRYLNLEDAEKSGIRIPEGKQVYVYLPNRVKELVVTTPEFVKTYTTFTDHLYVIESCDGQDDASLEAQISDGGTQSATVYTCPDALEEEVVQALSKSVLENVRAFGNTLSGTITADRDGELVITVPYDKSWSCYVDGVKTQPDCIGEALTGLPLTKGDHEIRMTYMPDGILPGLGISASCLLLMILSVLYERKKRRKEMNMTPENALTDETITRIVDLVGEDAVHEMEPMEKHTTFRIGGPADAFVTVGSEEELLRLLALLRSGQVPFFVTAVESC